MQVSSGKYLLRGYLKVSFLYISIIFRLYLYISISVYILWS